MMKQQDVQVFKDWLDLKGGSLHKDVEIRPTRDRGWCIYARADIPESTVLSTVPKSALLSVRNGRLADVLEQEKIGECNTCVTSLPVRKKPCCFPSEPTIHGCVQVEDLGSLLPCCMSSRKDTSQTGMRSMSCMPSSELHECVLADAVEARRADCMRMVYPGGAICKAFPAGCTCQPSGQQSSSHGCKVPACLTVWLLTGADIT